jgi:phosphoglycolate phosphatase
MPLKPPADAAIFDFDGVIIDSIPPVESAINGSLQAHGFEPRPTAEIARCIGPPTPVAFAQLTGAAEDSGVVAECVATYHEIFASVYLEQTRLFEGMAELVSALTVPRALATAKEHRFVGPLLEHFGLEFDAVSAPELAEPKAATVARALRALGSPSAAVMIGDRIYDIEAARACSMRVIAVSWGTGDREELRTADHIVDRPEELAQLLCA